MVNKNLTDLSDLLGPIKIICDINCSDVPYLVVPPKTYDKLHEHFEKKSEITTQEKGE